MKFLNANSIEDMLISIGHLSKFHTKDSQASLSPHMEFTDPIYTLLGH